MSIESETGHGSDTGKWLREIIEVIGDEALTVEEISHKLGTRFPTPETVPVESYVEFLLGEKLIVETERTQHFVLSDSAKPLLDQAAAER